ncbi:uncharacterized protein LOC126794900 [Argentina anserina]|uniref:uncharacterized protein LOC126794900 n=1 Tax=Argentina anserina TaxID=57926 RepID=UPI0021766106|nr:uncharacterized protein LOC126794900 [Potentilla anserina]
MWGGDLKEPGEPLYVFTHRRSKHFDRKVGSGTWSSQNLDRVAAPAHPDVVLGFKREFRYIKGSDSVQNGAWLMTEYEITSHSDLLLCALRRSPRATEDTAPPPKQKKKSNKRKKNEEEAVNTLKTQESEPSTSTSSLDVEQLDHLVHDSLTVRKMCK